jgi:hypothetical protein
MFLQIIITVLVVLALVVVVSKKRQNKMTLTQAGAWFVMWLVVLIVFWYPESTNYLASTLGIGRGADLIIYVAILAMFYMMFRMYLRVDKLNSDITEVVRKVGIDKANINKDKS